MSFFMFTSLKLELSGLFDDLLSLKTGTTPRTGSVRTQFPFSEAVFSSDKHVLLPFDVVLTDATYSCDISGAVATPIVGSVGLSILDCYSCHMPHYQRRYSQLSSEMRVLLSLSA
jgi:hypothetical protein